MSKSKNNESNNNSNENGQSEKLYRFHPEFGFTEVSQNEEANTNTQVNANTENSAPYANPNVQGQMPPFMPHNPYYNCYQGAGYQNPFHAMHGAGFHNGMHGAGFHNGMHGAGFHNGMHGAGFHSAFQGQHQQGYTAEHMRQMQDYANQHAAHMASMSGNSQNMNNNEYANPQFTQERMQEMYGTFNDIMNGKAEPTKILGLFQGVSSDFWKGTALGAAAVALYTCSPLKDIIGSSLATILAAAGLVPPSENQDDGFDDVQAEEMDAEANDVSTNPNIDSNDK